MTTRERTVVVRPSGHAFPVQGRETILQAGVKAGLPFNYGCGSGNCGLCKCRVVSGETRRVGTADYPLSALEREQGYVLMCASAPVGDIVVEALEAGGPADIPAQQIVATVRGIAPLGDATLLLSLQTPRSQRLRFLAGQSVTLGMSTPHGGAQHTYALANCPCDDRNLQFHIARDPRDAFARLLFGGQVSRGDTITVRGPYGDFVLERDGARPLIFIACDTGFAPVRSLIEHALAAETADCYSLYWLATRADGHYLGKECKSWASAFDRFEYQPLTDADASRGARRIANVLANGGGCSGGDVHIAGPAPFVDTVVATMRAHELAPARLAMTTA
jgi:CDP-4-dehydro-6-deoxyglucose reductase